MKKLIFIALGLIGGFVLIVSGFLFYLSRDLGENTQLIIEAVDLSQIEDGTYVGTHEGGRFSNTVEVTIENGHIQRIRLIESVRFDRPDITTDLLLRVSSESTLDVDIEAGATVTSLSYLKAIENALKAGYVND